MDMLGIVFKNNECYLLDPLLKGEEIVIRSGGEKYPSPELF